MEKPLVISESAVYICSILWNLLLDGCTHRFGESFTGSNLSDLLPVDTCTGLSVKFCQNYLWFYSMGGAIIFTTAINAILVLRLYALFGRSFRVLAILIAILTVEFATEFYISFKIGLVTQKTAFVAPPGVPLPGCLATAPTHFTLASWIPCLIAATIFFLMTAYKMLQSLADMRRGGISWSIQNQHSISPILLAFFQDGTIYFSLIAVILLVCTITTIVLEGPMKIVGQGWLIAIYSFSGSRLILNLRQAARHDGIETETITLQTFHALPMAA